MLVVNCHTNMRQSKDKNINLFYPFFQFYYFYFIFLFLLFCASLSLLIGMLSATNVQGPSQEHTQETSTGISYLQTNVMIGPTLEILTMIPRHPSATAIRKLGGKK